MPVEVQYAVASSRLPLPEAALTSKIAAWAAGVISAAGECFPKTDPDVCIRLVDQDESRMLNAQFRGKDKPTNVLSFPVDPLPAAVAESPLGDIVICMDVVADEAEQQAKDLIDHLAHMVVHGMLHLYGYDHERDAQSMLEMENLEREILDRFDVGDPYLEQ
jgi:probable rRNA maturation factor